MNPLGMKTIDDLKALYPGRQFLITSMTQAHSRPTVRVGQDVFVSGLDEYRVDISFILVPETEEEIP